MSDSIPEVLQTLDFWIQTVKSTKRMLAHHATASEMDSPESAAMSRLPGTNPEFRKKVESNIASDREALRQQLLNATDEELGKGGFLNEGQDPQYVREYIRDHIDEFVDTIYKSYRGGKVPLFEENWYRLFKVFLPPAELRKRHSGFDAAWKEILDGREVNPGLQQKAGRSHTDSTTADVNSLGHGTHREQVEAQHHPIRTSIMKITSALTVLILSLGSQVRRSHGVL